MDTSRARASILGRIRTAQGRGAATSSDAERMRDYLARHPRGPQPVPFADPVERFVEQALRMSSTVDRVPTMHDVPLACRRYLDESHLEHRAACWNTLADLAWTEAGIEAEFRAPRDEDRLGISGCFCAIAETGTLLFLSSPETPSTTHLLPDTHIAIVARSRIVSTIEDAFDLVRRERRELPRSTNFVSGPSRTGDIEQTIVLGAHGPYRVHVILVESA